MQKQIFSSKCKLPLDRGRIQLDSNFLSGHKLRGKPRFCQTINLFSSNLISHRSRFTLLGMVICWHLQFTTSPVKSGVNQDLQGRCGNVPVFPFPNSTCRNKSDEIIRLAILLRIVNILEGSIVFYISNGHTWHGTFICGACQNLNSF